MAATRLAYYRLLHVQNFYYLKTTTTAFLGFIFGNSREFLIFLAHNQKGNVWRFSNKIDS